MPERADLVLAHECAIMSAMQFQRAQLEPWRRRLRFALLAGVCTVGLGCRQGVAFDGGALLTELYVQNDSSLDLSVTWTVTGGSIAADGEAAAPPAETTLLLKEVDGSFVLPSELLDTLTIREQGQSEVLLAWDPVQDEPWTEGESDAVRTNFTLVVTDEMLLAP